MIYSQFFSTLSSISSKIYIKKMTLDLSRTMNILIFKGTVSVISSDRPCKDGNTRFTTVPTKSYSDRKCGIVNISASFSIASSKQGMRKSISHGESANVNNSLKKTKSLISNSFLTRQSFQGHRCKSGIAIFAWRLTWNYAYSPFSIKYIILG